MAQAGKKFGKDLDFRISAAASSANSTGNWVNISAWVQSVDGLPGEREMADVTAGGGPTAHAYLLGLTNCEFSLQCLFDQTTGSAYDTLSEFMNDTYHRHFAYYPAGATTDFPMMHGACWVKSLVLAAKPLEPLQFVCNLVGDSSMTVTVCAT
jgi:hypothetical protein